MTAVPPARDEHPAALLRLDDAPSARPGADPAAHWPRLTAATTHLDPPLGVIDRAALAYNAADLVRRAGGAPIRVASKSIRVRGVLEAVLARPGFAGVLAYTLPEALWLADSRGRGGSDIDDVVVGYPSTDRAALARLAADEQLAARVTLMIDDVAHLDLIDAVAAPGSRPSIRVALELDASWRAPLLGHVGVRRSPLHTPEQLATLARTVAERRGFVLDGVMAYEAQLAGLGDALPGRPLRSALIRGIQRASRTELADRRGRAVAAVRAIADAAGAPLRFVNGGGTGSLESTAADDSVTELAAGSGLLGPHLFDTYRAFRPAPAAAFALPVVRRPADDIATLLGGGWIASGPPGPDRLPQVVWPQRLRMLSTETAGEVQTPLRGPAAAGLRVGDRVWLRHTKAGELAEHLDLYAVVDGDRVVGELPTYRGEGKVFL
ncbi:D-serine deaminase-like pyridoxal phosphate-dependent protein [Chryseoglobus frigidaquae]|uniref:D-serine deaminase-like pyridoxal phosphate-dependent protein n=1 Tax=Microcella frigidaquae TaxID=424758 RepID=A0A840X839_9MICO|nr:D-serine deaminase-like pyridoxal phosphate-dependent protein [Microcella frigidaquae]